MSQIHVQWSHFWRLLVSVDFDDGCNTKICSVDHTIIVIYINGVGYMGSSEMSQIHVLWSHFWRQLVTVNFDDVSLQKYVQLIIQSLLYISMVCAIWGLPKCRKFGCCAAVVTLLEAVGYC